MSWQLFVEGSSSRFLSNHASRMALIIISSKIKTNASQEFFTGGITHRHIFISGEVFPRKDLSAR